ncbi:MAG: Rnf-Nqr domain containing protein [Oscillospiraceae bacterium]
MSNFYKTNKVVLDRFNGLLFGNTILERGLVLAPVIVATTTYKNALILGIAFFMITFTTVLLSSFVPRKVPYTVRVILYTLLACALFIPTAMLMDKVFPESIFKLGVFLPLLVANSLIVVKSESRFHKHKKREMVLDLFCHCVGFFIVILLVGAIREILGAGTIMGHSFNFGFTVPGILYPFGGFIIVSFLAALMQKIKNKAENNQK